MNVCEIEDWPDVYAILKEYRRGHAAPVDSMGASQFECRQYSRLRGKKYRSRRFKLLVFLILSAQSKDEKTTDCMKRIMEALGENFTPKTLSLVNINTLEKILYPINFFKKKSRYIGDIGTLLYNEYEDDVPDTYENLVNIKGIGPKIAHLYLQLGLNIVEGISVDTHVHRICNRIGFVSTKTPKDTQKSLEEFVPKGHWEDTNHLLVGFGQILCKPTSPECEKCPVSQYCKFFNTKKTSGDG